MSLNDDEKKDLRDVSILMAYSKVRSLSTVTALLQAAATELMHYPELHILRDKIWKVSAEIPNYADQFLCQVVGIKPEDFDHYEPNDYERLRVKEARERGLPLPEDDEWEAMEELGPEDPLAILARIDNPRAT